MRSLRRLWRAGRIAVLAMAGSLAFYGAALAQGPGKPAAAAPSVNSMTYVMAYFLVIFGVALGMLFVCRSSNRRERARPEQFEAKTVKGEEEE